MVSLMVAGTGSIAGAVKVAPQLAATSCARPRILKQSARLGVRSTSIAWSSSSRNSCKPMPTGASEGNSSKPEWSSDKPSSRAEQAMPKDSTPRSLAFLILYSPPSTAPTLASGTLIPGPRIRRAAHNLYRFCITLVNRAHLELVGIGMWLRRTGFLPRQRR